MVDFIRDRLLDFTLEEGWQGFNGQFWASVLAYVGTILFILLIVVASQMILRKIVVKGLKAYSAKSKFKWLTVFVAKKIPERIIKLVPAIIIAIFAPLFPGVQTWLERLTSAYIVYMSLQVVFPAIDALEILYSRKEIAKERPIKGILQVVKIILGVLGGIMIVAGIMDKSPWVLISGIGVFSAVIILVFQNSILGFVAGMQLTANDMVRVGDWIEMPKYNADGDIIEISLHTVKVQNFDKTITMIPAQALINDSFKNWRGMFGTGGRRIMRSVHIDVGSVKFCNDEMLERFKEIHLIKEYIERKIVEIEDYNKEHKVNLNQLVNGRRLTNIGTFRAYVLAYLKNHPKIHKDLLTIVRQLEPGANGIPIQVYAFINDTVWMNYESIQSDIFDHILAVVPQFDLRIFQNPTGTDMKEVFRANNSLNNSEGASKRQVVTSSTD